MKQPTRIPSRSSNRSLAKRTLLFALVVTTSSTLADACPTCRSALAEGGAHWAHGFALSIAVLLGVMLLAGGTFGLAVWRATRGSD